MSTPPTVAAPGWWEHRFAIPAFLCLAALPLLWPDIPPLVDLPGHMGRYKLQLDLADSPFLQRFYGFEWRLIGNLGVDLLVVPLARLIGLEPAVKLIVIAIPTMTVAGFLLVAREAHGRVPPTALFALPFAYNYPFMFGFVNFALSMALAFLAFALWLRLGRLERTVLRAWLFVPISLVLWVTHIFGWGTLGLLAGAAELVRQRAGGGPFVPVALRAARSCLVLAPPLVLMLVWRSGEVTGDTGDWFDMITKWRSFLLILHDRWGGFGQLCLLAVMIVILLFARRRAFGVAPVLGLAALLLLLVFLGLPRIVFGSAFADMRLAPYVVAMALLAIRPPPAGSAGPARTIAALALAFMVTRTAATTASFAIYDRSWDRELAALERLPRAARVASFTHYDCRHEGWGRLDHLPAIAIVRRGAFTNDQWMMPGAQLLRVVYPAAGGFVSDPSQLVTRNDCSTRVWKQIDVALRTLPRDAFDYVWLISPPPYDAGLTRGLTPVWRSGSSVLFRIDR